MKQAAALISTIEAVLSTKSKQHIVGGILFSAAIFLGTLAVTVFTMKIDSDKVVNEQVVDPYECEYDEEADEEYEYE